MINVSKLAFNNCETNIGSIIKHATKINLWDTHKKVNSFKTHTIKLLDILNDIASRLDD